MTKSNIHRNIKLYVMCVILQLQLSLWHVSTKIVFHCVNEEPPVRVIYLSNEYVEMHWVKSNMNGFYHYHETNNEQPSLLSVLFYFHNLHNK